MSGDEIRRRFALALAAFLSLAPGAALGQAGAPAAEAPRPRELSAAERAAVEMAVAYLQGGPAAWWDRLAAGAPLRQLGRAAALDEIAARVGPADGASWQLLTPGIDDPERAVFGLEHASGLDETLTLQLAQEAGGWKIAAIRSTIDPISLDPVVPAAGKPPAPRAAAEPAAAPPAPAPVPAAPAVPPSPLLPLLGLGAAFLALVGGAIGALLLGRAGRNAAAGAVGALALAVIGGSLLWGRNAAPPPGAGAGAARGGGRSGLGTLAPLRAALADGGDRAEITRLLALAPADPKMKPVQDLWRAQLLLGEGDLNGAEAILRGFPQPSPYPLAELLRARLAFRRMQRAETGWLYEQAIARGLDNDGLRLEAAFAKALTDEAERAEGDLAATVQMGSRLAEPWYVAAQLAISQDRMDDAEAFLRRAWQLEPVPREQLFDNALLAHLVVRPNLFPLFTLGVPEEARLPAAGTPQPLALPAGSPAVTAATCGQALRLAVGSAEVTVPNGAAFAPAGAVLEDADTWSRHAEAKALAALPAMIASASAGAGAAEALPPRLLRLAGQAGLALAKQNRWEELVRMTEPLAQRIENAPADLVRLRAQALHHLERDGDARLLLVRVAKSDIASRRPSTGTLFDLAELFAAAGDYDTAIKLLEKADSQLPEPRGLQRRKQLAMDRDLALSYGSYQSEHFEVRYPRVTAESYARQIAWVLEEERQRLQRWIPPVPHSPRIEVHLFQYKDFVANFGGDIAIIGLFDGKVRVPFAELRTVRPEAVAILSHELAHALIAQATRGQAPHWMQEGLAQHIEMGTKRVNPLPDLRRTGHGLSFPTVDPILRGFAEEQLVDLAYNEAAWSVAFIETRFGETAIPRLLTAFGAGKTTEQALHEVCGVTPAEFDRAFWEWGTTKGPAVRALAVRNYDDEAGSAQARAHDEATPKTGMRIDVAAERRARMEEWKRRLADWHTTYAARTAAVKSVLKPILQAYSGEVTPPPSNTAAVCRDLETEVSRVLADDAPWASPDPDLNQSLRETYNLIGHVGTACRSGRDAETRVLIRKVGEALNRIAQRLAPYGLAP